VTSLPDGLPGGDPPDGQDSLEYARKWLRDRVEDGATCPCCKQLAKVYHRKINAGQARSLIRMYRADPARGYVHLPTVVGSRSREEAKLRYWGLLEEERAKRKDGGRAGFWRITDRGELFVLGQLRVPKYSRIYGKRCLGLDDTETASIVDALGTDFDYRELMEGI
jgi:hypothetical protein